MQSRVFDLGLIDFSRARDFQQEAFSRVKDNEFKAALIFCRHYPVITLGRNAEECAVLASSDELKAKGISIYEIERGGSVTYHGPGQLVVYPVFNLNYFKKDVNLFLRSLEVAIIAALAKFSIPANTREGLTGVWVENKKIASIGIAIRNWITYHGLAINVKKDDLANFSLIRPCGMDIMMTAMETELGRHPSFELVKMAVRESFLNLTNEIGVDYNIKQETAR